MSKHPDQPHAVDALLAAWRHVLNQAEGTNRAWLRSSRPLTVHESTVMISVPNEFTRERIETRQRSDIEQALSDHFHRSMRLAITIDPDLELNLQPPDRPEEADIEPMELIRRPDAPSPFTPMDPAHAQSPAPVPPRGDRLGARREHPRGHPPGSRRHPRPGPRGDPGRVHLRHARRLAQALRRERGRVELRVVKVHIVTRSSKIGRASCRERV